MHYGLVFHFTLSEVRWFLTFLLRILLYDDILLVYEVLLLSFNLDMYAAYILNVWNKGIKNMHLFVIVRIGTVMS
jgi:hypothetical protein